MELQSASAVSAQVVAKWNEASGFLIIFSQQGWQGPRATSSAGKGGKRAMAEPQDSLRQPAVQLPGSRENYRLSF